MHKNHLLGCAVGIASAIVLLRLTGGSLGSVGVLVAALACPLIMLVMMKMLMGDQAARLSKPRASTAADHNEAVR